MKKKEVLLLSLLFVLLSFLKTFAQQKNISKAKMIKDFEVFQDVFEQANSGLYKYQEKEKVYYIFKENKKKITDSTSLREFYNLIYDVIDFTGSSHNYLDYPSTLKKGFYTQELSFVGSSNKCETNI